MKRIVCVLVLLCGVLHSLSGVVSYNEHNSSSIVVDKEEDSDDAPAEENDDTEITFAEIKSAVANGFVGPVFLAVGTLCAWQASEAYYELWKACTTDYLKREATRWEEEHNVPYALEDPAFLAELPEMKKILPIKRLQEIQKQGPLSLICTAISGVLFYYILEREVAQKTILPIKKWFQKIKKR